MPDLTDTQTILLSHASRRENGSLYPLPDTLRPGGGTAKSVAALTGRDLAEERETADRAFAHRVDGDLAYGLFITPAGLAAIGVEDGGGTTPASATAPCEPTTIAAEDPCPASPPKPARGKTAGVLALLGRGEGATLGELIEATGWLPHTTRAALTGLRKRGHAIERGKRDGATCYRVVAG